MAVRKKRSISVPADLDAQIAAAAEARGMTYSAWLAATARKEFLIQDGMRAVTEFERDHGALSDAERDEAARWARDAMRRSGRSGKRRRRSA